MMVQMQAQMGSLQGSVAALQRQRDADAEAAAASAALASLASSQQQVPQVQAIQLATGAPAAQATPPTPARAVPTPLRYPPGLQQPRPAVDPLQPAAVQPSFQEVDGVRSNAQAIVRDPTAAPSDREAAAAWLAADAAQWLDEEEEHENEARWSALHGVVDPSATHEAANNSVFFPNAFSGYPLHVPYWEDNPFGMCCTPTRRQHHSEADIHLQTGRLSRVVPLITVS
jgi:hypothetical protein